MEIQFLEEGGTPPAEGSVVFMNPNDLGPSPFDGLVNPPQTQEALAALEQSIRESGVTNPVIVWANSGKDKPPVVAGNTRLSIAVKLKLASIPVMPRVFASKTAAKEFALRENLERREIDATGRAQMGDELWRLFDAAPDKKEMAARGLGPRKRAALATHVGEGTLAEYRYIAVNATDEVKAKLAARELSVHAAYTLAYNALNPKTEASGRSVRTEKVLTELAEFSALLKKLPDIITRTQAAAKTLVGAKKVERERVTKKLENAAAVIAAAEDEQTLAKLREALGAAKSAAGS